MGVPRSETGVKAGGTTQTAPVTPQPGGGGYDLGSVMSGYVPPGGGGVGGNRGEPQVYFGNFTGDHEAQAPGGARPKVMSLSFAKLNFHTWTPGEQQAWANKMYRAGLINDPGDFDAAIRQWNSAVEFAANEYTYGHKKVTPWDVMQDRLGLSKLQGNGGGRAGRVPSTRTTTSTASQVLNNGDADQMIKAIFQNQIGRDPDKGELSRYRSMLINKVEDSPTVTKTTESVDADGNMTVKSKSSGGTTEGQLTGMVSDRNKADPEWGAYQAATSYMGALEQLLGGGTPDLTGSNG